MRSLLFRSNTRSNTRKLDWLTIALFLISLFSFAGVAAIMWMHSG